VSIKWPNIFSAKPDIQNQFINVCTQQYLEAGIKIGLDRDFPTTTTLYKNANYAIWNGGPSVLQSAWNDHQIVKGNGWVNPFKTEQSERKNFFGAMVNIPWSDYQTNEVKQNSKIIELTGDYAGFHTWWHNNYGHIIHDNLPYLTWFLSVIPEDYKILMLKSKVKQNMLKELDPKLLNRIVWINIGETIKIKGNLIVSTPDVHPCIMGNNFMQYFKKWITNCKISRNPKDVIFYTRHGTTNRRVLDLNNEQTAINTIKTLMQKYNIQGELKIFSGQNGNQETLSIAKQIEIFSNAHTIIGPHGTGLINMIYSDLNKVKILEFVPSVECGSVQRPFNGYHNVMHGLYLNYNHILYTDDSKFDKTFIKISDLENALNSIWK